MLYEKSLDWIPQAGLGLIKIAPFLDLGALLDSGCADGVIVQGESHMPCRRFFPGGLAIGGYLHSEITTLAAGSPDWDQLSNDLPREGFYWILAEAPNDDEVFRCMSEKLQKAGWKLFELPGRTPPYIHFDGPPGEDFYTFMRRSNSKEYRNLFSSRRKLEQAGKVEITFMEQAICPEIIAMLSEVELKSRKKNIGIFSQSRQAETLSLLGQQPVRLALMYLDGKLIAWDIDFICDNIVYSYNRSYDLAYSSLAPGKILHYENLAQAHAQGVVMAELLGDSDPLKMRIATGVRQRVRLAAFSPSSVGNIACVLYKLRHSLKRFFRDMRPIVRS